MDSGRRTGERHSCRTSEKSRQALSALQRNLAAGEAFITPLARVPVMADPL